MTTHTIGSFLFDAIEKQGTTHVFGIPGDFALPTFRWLEKSNLNLITMTHEPSVGFAADGYARITKQMGVAIVTYCVGGLNMLNSIACAYAEKSPVLVISGGPSPNDRKRESQLIHHKVRTFDSQRKIYDEVTCASAVLLDPETAADEILRVIRAVQEHSLPGYIEVPYDMVDAPIKAPSMKNIAAAESDPENLKACVQDVVAKLQAAKQPVIIADIELHRFGLTDMAMDLATRCNIPVASTLLSKSVISEHNPLYIGVYSGRMSEEDTQAYIESSDCVIMLGAFVSDVLFGFGANVFDRKHLIVATNEKINVEHASYDHVLFKDFLSLLLQQKLPSFSHSAPLPSPAPIPQPLVESETGDEMTVEAFFRILGLHVGENNTVVCDTGDSVVGAIRLRTKKRNNFLSDAYYLSMGFAVPAALGAQVAQPDARVFAIVGDGAFQMTGTELSTAAKYGLKPIVLILNNDGYGTQRKILDGSFNNIHRWHYTKICDLLGYGKATQVRTKGEFEKALKDAIEGDYMALIEVMIDRNDYSRSLLRLGEELGKRRDPEKRIA